MNRMTEPVDATQMTVEAILQYFAYKEPGFQR